MIVPLDEPDGEADPDTHLSCGGGSTPSNARLRSYSSQPCRGSTSASFSEKHYRVNANQATAGSIRVTVCSLDGARHALTGVTGNGWHPTSRYTHPTTAPSDFGIGSSTGVSSCAERANTQPVSAAGTWYFSVRTWSGQHGSFELYIR